MGGIFFGSSRGSFSKKNCPKQIFPSDFVKLGPEILDSFLAEKMVVFFFFFCCNTLSDFCLIFVVIDALVELRKMLLRNKLFDVQLGNCSTPEVL